MDYYPINMIDDNNFSNIIDDNINMNNNLSEIINDLTEFNMII